MSGRKVARRYAKALYEVAEKTDNLDEVGNDIKILAEILSEPRIRDFCLRSSASPENRSLFLATAITPYMHTRLVKNFINTVRDNSREALIAFFPAVYNEIENEHKGIITVYAEFASEPSEHILFMLKKQISKRLNSEIQLIGARNEKLLHGFRIIWQNQMLDRSAAGRLRELKKVLLK